MPDTSTVILRRVTAVRDAFLLEVDALPAVAIDPMPGWITGEPLLDQGVETTMPNLPDLQLPDATPQSFALRVAAVAPDTLRLTVARPGEPVLDDDGTWLGIVTDPQPAPAQLRQSHTATEVVLETDLVRVRVTRAPFALRVEDVATGRILCRTADRLRQVAGFAMAPAILADAAGTSLNLELAPEERILGFGEQFGPLSKNGQRLTLRAEDALGTGTGLAYKPVPVWHSTLGYTGFLNTGAVVTADVGHARPSVLALAVADAAIDLYLVAGGTPKQRLRSYTALTGRAYVPPLWAFGYWMGRCRYHGAAEMLQVARGMRDRRVPCDVLHCDPDWLVTDRLNCDFIWNTDRFGDRATFVADLAAEQIRLSLWELPYLDPASPRYSEALEHGYLAVDADGKPVSIENTPTPDGRPRGLVDFFNPAARRWWQDLHTAALADGVAVFKTDFGEALPATAVPADGLPPNHAHNLYPLRYNGAVSDAVRRVTGDQSLVWGRSGWAGSQRYPGQWGGDAESTVAGMHSTLRGGLSYALSAPGLWSHDIGGFFGTELTSPLYLRWTQFGALSPLMRAHGLRPREPWAFDEHTLDIARDWVRLRYSLLPYLWQVAHEAAAQGWPMLRPLSFEFPDDPVAEAVDGQFMLGSDLLVVPIFDDGAAPVRRRFYLPAGAWTDLLTEQTLTGPGYRDLEVPLHRMPVFVRHGTVLPRLDIDEQVRNTDDLLGRPWIAHLYGAVDGPREMVGFDRSPLTLRITSDRVQAAGAQPVAAAPVRHA